MMRTDYKAIHDAIREKIEEYDFEYQNAAEWFNLEAGDEIPQGLPGKAFNIQFGDQDSPVIQHDAVTTNTPIIVEFLLDAKKDDYLRHIGFCQEAIESLVYMELDGIDARIVSPQGSGHERFNRTFVVGEKVILTFDSINVDVRTFKQME